MKMRCFFVPIVSLSFWIQGMIAVCDLCDPCVLRKNACVCVGSVCVYAHQGIEDKAGWSRWLCMLWGLYSRAHLVQDSRSLIQVGSELHSKNATSIRKTPKKCIKMGIRLHQIQAFKVEVLHAGQFPSILIYTVIFMWDYFTSKGLSVRKLLA